MRSFLSLILTCLCVLMVNKKNDDGYDDDYNDDGDDDGGGVKRSEVKQLRHQKKTL